MMPDVDSKVLGYEEIDAMLEAFEAAERKSLNLDQEPVAQWSDPNPQTFTRAQRDSTTILFGGLKDGGVARVEVEGDKLVVKPG